MKVLNIRGIDEEVARSFSVAAMAREWTQAEYLRRLMRLHSYLRLDHSPEYWTYTGEDAADPNGQWAVADIPHNDFIAQLGEYLAHEGLMAIQT